MGTWVSGGGILVVTGVEGQRLFGNKVPAWFGAEAWWNGAIEPGSAEVLRPDHPLAKGLDAKGVSQLTGTGGVLRVAKGASLIGAKDVSFFMAHTHGKGHVVFLGGNLSPQGRPKWTEKRLLQDLSPLTVQLWRNLIQHFRFPLRSEAIAQWGAKHPRPLALWWRYEKEKPLGGAALYAPFPLPGEELSALTFNVGIGERCWKRFFLTNKTSLAALTATPTDLTGPGGRKIPSSALTVYVQEKPWPDYPKAPYWLVEPRHVTPVGKPSIRIEANRTTTYWVKLKCVDAAPGDYTGALDFQDAGKPLHRLPLRVKVWPLHQPGPDVLHYELEHLWFTLPGGYHIRPKDPKLCNPGLLAKYMQHLAEMGVDFGQSWSDVAKGYCLSFVRLKEDSRLLRDVMERDPKILRREKLPALDFSGYDKIYFDNAIEAGLTSFAMNYLFSKNLCLSFARKARPAVKPLSPEHMRFVHWYWSEYATYLKERGYTRVYTKILDEFGPKGVDEFIRHARVIRPAGFRVYTTTPNLQYDAAAVAKIDPWLDMWQWCVLSKPWDKIARQRRIPWDETNELWAYTASSFWGNYCDYARGAGWAIAWRRYAGLHTHGYMRWYWNDHEGALPGPDGPFDSVTVINNGQSVYQARYLASLYRMIDYAKRTGKARRVATDVENQIETVIGPAPTALIPIVERNLSGGVIAPNYGKGLEEAYPLVCLSPERYEAAKVRVFGLTVTLKKALGDVRPSVKYGETYLVKDGRPTCRVVCEGDEGPARILRQAVLDLAGVAPPSVSGAKDEPATAEIVMGSFAGSARVREVVAKEAPGQITPSYPGPGRYAVKYFPKTARGARILVVGGDVQGVENGARCFCKFLVAENRW